MGEVRKYHSISELEDITGIPDSTIRRYIGRFPDFFIEYGGGRVRKYEESAIKVLTRIKMLFDSGHGAKEVDAILSSQFPTIADGGNGNEEETNSRALATADDIADIKALLQEERDAREKQNEFNKILVEKLDEHQRYIKDSLEKRDRVFMEEVNARLEMAATEKKGWLARIFRKK